MQQHERRPLRLVAWLPHDRGWCAAATQFPGTLFFNISTFAALARNASVAQVDRHVWRPDVFGSILFLVASAFAILALGGRFLSWAPRSVDWWIAWVNMLGSILFMVSAVGSFDIPGTGELLNESASVAGTLWGAVSLPDRRHPGLPRLAARAVAASVSPTEGEARPRPRT